MQELRTSERKTWGDCPQQWWWAYKEELAPNRPATALWFGAHWHDAMALWYQKGIARGQHPAEYLDQAISSERKIFVTTEEEEDEFIKAHDLAVAMAEGYIKEYGKDEQWEILAIEADFAILFKRQGNPYLRYLFCIDGLYRDLDTGEILILEHKTAKAIQTKHLRLDNQAGSYWAAAPYVLGQVVPEGKRIAGIQYNFARKAIPSDKPRNARGEITNKPTKKHYIEALNGKPSVTAGGTRTTLFTVKLNQMSLDALEVEAKRLGITVLGDVSKTQSPPYFVRPPVVYRTRQERDTQLRRIRDEAHYMERMRSGDPNFPVIKTPGDHCNWCAFRDMCELDEYDKAAAEGFKISMMKHQDPYQQYRKVA